MTYTVDIYATPWLLCASRRIVADTGLEAAALVRAEVTETGADHADLFQSDYCGGVVYYTTVHRADFKAGAAFYARRGEDGGDW